MERHNDFFLYFLAFNYISIALFLLQLLLLPYLKFCRHIIYSKGRYEWLVSAFLVGYVIGQLIYGPLANRFGRIKALRTGLVINILGILMCFAALYAHSYPILIIGRLITALGAASGLACTFMLINEWLPAEQRRTATAYTLLSFTLGIGFAVLLGGIITEYSYWGNCFVLLFVHGAIMLYGTRVFSETLITPQPINLSSILRVINRFYLQVLYSPIL